ncbi:MAG: nucleoside/nucleotide kinase family protein [Pelagimonas sp.]|uniref:nucleoside/nucleotide kinase family protein n=1 Tax=Pelagimonas sp. TaxID=2073170 RepID=UPI003D6AA4B8
MMDDPSLSVEALIDHIQMASRKSRRRLVALAGPPASGKSTLAENVARELTQVGCRAQVVPMDGFHLDNRILTSLGVLDRKGAPETFDVQGLLRLITALPKDDTVYYPVFDRSRDIAIAGAGVVDPTCDTVVVEGNYLLHDAAGWRDMADFWDVTIALDVPLETLRQRLVDRWLAHGLSRKRAEIRAEENDLKNAATIANCSVSADVTIRS